MLFSLFKKSTNIDHSVDSVMPESNVMTLEERKAWRLEMLKKSIYDVMTSNDISNTMYRYRVMPIDERWHHFAIMIDTTRDFALSRYTSTKHLIELEIQLKKDTFRDYGVIVDSVYWRANETIDIFERASTKKVHIPSIRPKKSFEELRNEFCDTTPIGFIDHHDPEKEPVFEPFSDSQIQQYRDRIANGDSKRQLRIGGKNYDTDLAPLSPE